MGTTAEVLALKEFYKMHLIKKIKKTNQKRMEMVYLKRQIRMTDLEIGLLGCRLEVGAWSQVNHVKYWNIKI